MNSTPSLTDVVFNRTRQLGDVGMFSGGTFPVEDDQLPFLRKGIPAVDITDVTPFRSYHHSAPDTIDRCSLESLTVIGRVVLATLARLERSG